MANYNEILMTDVFQSQMSNVSLTDDRRYYYQDDDTFREGDFHKYAHHPLVAKNEIDANSNFDGDAYLKQLSQASIRRRANDESRAA